MSSTSEDTSISNILIPALDSLQIDRPKSRDSSICSNDDSFCSLEIAEPSILPFQITSDELPIFSISSLSPTCRSLSPVMADQMCISPVDFADSDEEDYSDDLSVDNQDRMLLNDIHALIGTPDEKNDRRLLNLETIFEDVFLETPPKRKHLTPQQYERKRFSFDNISRYVRDQQQFDYCNGNYDHVDVDSECLNMEENKQDDL